MRHRIKGLNSVHLLQEEQLSDFLLSNQGHRSFWKHLFHKLWIFSQGYDILKGKAWSDDFCISVRESASNVRTKLLCSASCWQNVVVSLWSGRVLERWKVVSYLHMFCGQQLATYVCHQCTDVSYSSACNLGSVKWYYRQLSLSPIHRTCYTVINDVSVLLCVVWDTAWRNLGCFWQVFTIQEIVADCPRCESCHLCTMRSAACLILKPCQKF